VDLSLKGKAAIVCGASQGIGYAIAHLLVAEGAAVAMVARRKEALNHAVDRLHDEFGSSVVAIPADIRKPQDCERIINDAVTALGRLDILVNNDGAPPLGRLETFDDKAWDKALQQNLMSVVRLSRLALPEMIKTKAGRIINIAALSALQPMPRFGLSVATWAGMIGYAKTLSLEVAGKAVTVNTICPGRIATSRLVKVFGTPDQGETPDATLLDEIVKAIPMRRVGTPAEIAGLVAFLASPHAAYITGSVFHVDGGRRASLV